MLAAFVISDSLTSFFFFPMRILVKIATEDASPQEVTEPIPKTKKRRGSPGKRPGGGAERGLVSAEV